MSKTEFADLVDTELSAARLTHPAIGTLHEGLGVILEEFVEFQTEVFKREEARKPDDVLKELVHTAARCRRVAEDLALVGTLSDAVFGRAEQVVRPPVPRRIAATYFIKGGREIRVQCDTDAIITIDDPADDG